MTTDAASQTSTGHREPDAGTIAPDGLPSKPFPASRPFRVCFSAGAHEGVWDHARETLSDLESIKEVGGFLIGGLYRDDAGPYLEIKAALRGKHTRNEGTEVGFTPETWAAVNAQRDADFPGDGIVGWYHTHPRFGIFLSDRDQFVHRHSFGQPWATAFVVDPVQNLEGLFAWNAGEPQRVQEYWVGQTRKLFSEADAKTEMEPEERTQPRKQSWIPAIGVALVSLVLIAAFAVIYYRSAMEWAAERQIVIQALYSERQDLDRAAQILGQLRSRVEAVAEQAKDGTDRMRSELKQVEASLGQVTQLNRSLQQQIEGIKGQNGNDRSKP